MLTLAEPYMDRARSHIQALGGGEIHFYAALQCSGGIDAMNIGKMCNPTELRAIIHNQEEA